jgi:tRNA A-37 threonylcarbamoyl transferase component Bud32
LTPSGIPNIPRCPTRDEIGSGLREVLVRGIGAKADVVVVDLDGGSLLVKDYAGRNPWMRLLGRLQLGREAAAYAWLEGVSGVPAFVGRIDRWAIAIEWIDGELLAFAPLSAGEGPRHLAQLRTILDSIHARGVVHNDLRGRENVLRRRDGRLAVIDFAAAIRLRPGGIAHRLFFRLAKSTDEAAFLKWKGMIAPGTYTPSDEAVLRRFERWRRFWPFNPKRRKAKSRAA